MGISIPPVGRGRGNPPLPDRSEGGTPVLLGLDSRQSGHEQTSNLTALGIEVSTAADARTDLPSRPLERASSSVGAVDQAVWIRHGRSGLLLFQSCQTRALRQERPQCVDSIKSRLTSPDDRIRPPREACDSNASARARRLNSHRFDATRKHERVLRRQGTARYAFSIPDPCLAGWTELRGA
jgi:hypothetical protein